MIPTDSAITTIKGDINNPNFFSPPPDFYGAFSACTALTNMTIPSTVTQLGGYNATLGIYYGCVFKDCTNLLYVLFGDIIQIDIIGDYMFSGCSKIILIPLPSTVTTLGAKSFYDCTDLKIFYDYL